MLTIEMIWDKTGCEDGFTLVEYKQGERYDVLPSLAARFLRVGAAKIVATPHPDTFIAENI